MSKQEIYISTNTSSRSTSVTNKIIIRILYFTNNSHFFLVNLLKICTSIKRCQSNLRVLAAVLTTYDNFVPEPNGRTVSGLKIDILLSILLPTYLNLMFLFFI